MHISGQTEIGGVDNLVSRGVLENSLGVDTGLVGEGAETGDVVVEGDVDFDGLGDKVFEVTELLKLVLALDVLGGGNNHASHEATKRSNTVSLTNTENRSIARDPVSQTIKILCSSALSHMGSASLESAVGVGNGTAGIVVEMGLDIARNDTTKGADQVVDLSWAGTTNSVCNTLLSVNISKFFHLLKPWKRTTLFTPTLSTAL